MLLTNQLEMEKMKVEQEKKKCYLAQEALKEKVWVLFDTKRRGTIFCSKCLETWLQSDFSSGVFLCPQDSKSLSVSEAPASSTPSLSRSSSISGTEHAGLHSSIFSQVNSSHTFMPLDYSREYLTVSFSPPMYLIVFSLSIHVYFILMSSINDSPCLYRLLT